MRAQSQLQLRNAYSACLRQAGGGDPDKKRPANPAPVPLFASFIYARVPHIRYTTVSITVKCLTPPSLQLKHGPRG